LKGVGILFIIFIHARGAFIGNGIFQNTLDFILLNTGRFAVPIFFLISGYLFGIKIEESKEFSYTVKYFKKLLKCYLIGSGLFLSFTLLAIFLNSFLGLGIVSSIIELNLTGIEGLFNFLYLGKSIAPHLWFLTALIISIGIIYISQTYGKTFEVFLAGFLLHLFAILTNTYNVIQVFPVPQHDAVFLVYYLLQLGSWLGRGECRQDPKVSTYDQQLCSVLCIFWKEVS